MNFPAISGRPPAPRVAAMLFVAATGFMLLAGAVSPALGQQTHAAPVPLDADTSRDRKGAADLQPLYAALPLPQMPAETSPFLRDARLDLHLRTYYFDKENYDNSRNEAWAAGGALTFTSGYLADFLRIGATGYTSVPVYAPEDRDGTSLLKPGQEGYAVLGQAYAEAKITDRIFAAAGRKEYTTPYINKNDSRMTPNTFEAITAYGAAGGSDAAPDWRFIGGYVSKIKERNADRFVWMSRDAGARVDRGVSFAGANFARGDVSIGASNYYSEDIINIFYADGKYALPLEGPFTLSFGAQYADQRSTGDNLLTGREFSTNQWGLRADLGVGGATFTVAYTDTASGDNMRNPWSNYPGYTGQQILDFNRANESAVMLRAAYDFSRHGAPGLSAYALVVYGDGRKAPFFNETEYDLNLQWTPASGVMKGISYRLRYARAFQRGGGDPTQDNVRLIVAYDF